MTVVGFRASAEVSVSSAAQPTYIAALDENTRVSRRSGQMPRRAEMAAREANDKDYRVRMEKARKELAIELSQVSKLNLAQLRLKKGFSQVDLAKRIGTSQSHIAKIEAGVVNLYLKTAIRLADALSISLDELRYIVDVSQNEEPVAATLELNP